MKTNERLQELTAFMQKQGFIWGPSPEIYGGMAGFFTYGPLGKQLKTNVENKIRKVFMKNQFFEVECPTVLPKEVWEASGHLGNFSDPLIKCSKCNSIFRVDKIIEEFDESLHADGKTPEEQLIMIEDNNIKCPSCKGDFIKEIKQHDLMMKTTIGLDTVAYNRPETATTTYLPFPRYMEFFRDKLPFGVFQIGKAYRNEISPRMHVMRGREFTQAEAQIFIFPEQKRELEQFESIKDVTIIVIPDSMQYEKGYDSEKVTFADCITKEYMKSKAYAWSVYLAYEIFKSIGIPDSHIRFRQHGPTEKAFYADDAWDLEVKTESFGWVEMCGIHDRTNYDLSQHAMHSKKELIARNPENEKIVPHVLEIAFGVDRAVFAIIDLSYEQKDKEDGKTVLRIPRNIAPVSCAIYPLIKKDPLKIKAKELFNTLIDNQICIYDEAGSIGKRYLRSAMQGTPYCLTVDFDTLEDNSITIRDRDSEEQKRISLEKVEHIISDLLSGKIAFQDL